jgi:adhesin transport system membrane fusion protein
MRWRLGGGHFLLLVLAIFLGWAAMFQIDETVRLTGKVVPRGRTQIVQAADGGVLQTLYVQEGARVQSGDLLARLQDGRARAGVDELETQIAFLELARTRARAEAAGAAPRFSDPTLPAAQAQMAVYRQAREALAARTGSIRQSLLLARDEAARLETLFLSGDVSQMRRDAARREVLKLERDLSAARHEARGRALREAAELEEQIATLTHNLALHLDRLEHTELRAPQDGIVTHLAVNTIGGVLRPGDELLRISPTVGGTYMMLEVPPADIAQLQVGMPVSIRLDSFDYTVWGGLTGTLRYLSADSFTRGAGEEARSYYEARVMARRRQENPRLTADMLQPGFTGSVDILTGRRSVLAYLVKPVRRAFSGSLAEK